jgi:hypothetical protein
MGDSYVESTVSFLRIKQNLDLNNKNYDYSDIYVTNVKAKDAEFEFAGQTLNFSTLDGSVMDKLMKHILFNVSFDASKIYYNCYFNGENHSIDAPIVVEGNKVTIKMSENNSVYRDIEVYMFQDQDNTQMHMYMPTYAFENFLANTAVEMLANDGKLDLNDAAAVKAIFDEVEAAIETINVSFIFKTAKKSANHTIKLVRVGMSHTHQFILFVPQMPYCYLLYCLNISHIRIPADTDTFSECLMPT